MLTTTAFSISARTMRFMKIARSLLSSMPNRYQPASAHVEKFKELIGSNNVLTESFDIEKYTVDWTKVYKGGSVVCFPCSTDDVSNILRYCNTHVIGVVPQGGNTGLVGGSVGLSGERGDQLILSMEKMKSIRSIEDSVLVCDAGCILESVNSECNKKGYIIPLDLGAKGACMIGGNVATNAGGLRVLRYGSLHGSILGLEVVQADGTVLDMLRTLRKDNCGYHLPHLFIGSEGTLGVITKVAIALAIKPTSTAVVWAKVPSFAEIPKLLYRARAEVGEMLSAFEFLDGASLGSMWKISPHLLRSNTNEEVQQRGIPGEICVLMEFSSCSATKEDFLSNEGSDLTSRLNSFLEGLLEDGIVQDAVVSQSSEHEKELWSIREDLPLCLMQLSRCPKGTGTDSTQCIKLYKYDVSISLKDTESVVLMIKEQMRREMQGGLLPQGISLEYCCFGHAGDQNLHLNVLLHLHRDGDAIVSHDAVKLTECVQISLNRAVFKAVLSVKGSVSAEHGVGQQKRMIMNAARSPAELMLMSALKKTLDPNVILNPGKVLPDGYQ